MCLLFYEMICEHNISGGFFPRKPNLAIFFQIGGIYLVVFNFHDPEF